MGEEKYLAWAREKQKKWSDSWRKRNPERRKETEKARRRNDPIKERLRASKWRKENPEKARKYHLKRRAKPGYRVIQNIRTRLKNLLPRRNWYKPEENPFEIVGCSEKKLHEHLQNHWPPDGLMSWENYGGKGKNGKSWDIDHIVPIKHFNEIWKSGDEALIKKYKKLINHYTNLFPLWASINRGSKKRSDPEWVIVGETYLWSDLHEKIYGNEHDLDLNLDCEDSDRQF